MTLLKYINKASLLIPYELYIQTYHQNGHLILEECIGEQNPIYQLVNDTFHTSLSTKLTDQYPSNNTAKPIPSRSRWQAGSSIWYVYINFNISAEHTAFSEKYFMKFYF
jgi:hypothetical protein